MGMKHEAASVNDITVRDSIESIDNNNTKRMSDMHGGPAREDNECDDACMHVCMYVCMDVWMDGRMSSMLIRLQNAVIVL